MFEEVREMIDSTIYSNGRGEVTAQNVNLAMHGMIDATESAVGSAGSGLAEINKKIDELEKVVEENANNAVGLTFQHPLFALELLYGGESISPSDMYMDRVVANEIIAEFPTLAEPIDKLFENNKKAYETYVNAFSSGEQAPIVTVDVGALAKEIISIEEGIDMSMSYTVNPSAIICQPLLMPAIMMLVNLDGIQVTMSVVSDGSIGFMDNGVIPALINVPKPTESEVINTEFDVKQLYYYPYQSNHEFRYSSGDGNFDEYIFPTHTYISGSYILARFVIGAEVIEAYIHKESGATKSRVIATMTPVEVEVLPEGSLTKTNNLTYSYYDPIPAAGGFATLGIKSTVAWKLIMNGVVSAQGDATTGTTKEVLVAENTTGAIQTVFFTLVTNPSNGDSGVQLAQVSYTQLAS